MIVTLSTTIVRTTRLSYYLSLLFYLKALQIGRYLFEKVRHLIAVTLWMKICV